jgi:outer membrane scaffolding protein for murein synthesis (MipA/OmpV family)
MASIAAIFVLFLIASPFYAEAQEVISTDQSSNRASESVRQTTESSEEEEGSEFEFSLGAGVIVSPRPYVGTRNRVFPIPSIEIQYKRWFLQGIRGGYSFIQSEPISANLFSQVRFRGLEPENSPFLEGMDARKKSMDAGVEFIYRGRPVGFRATALTDILGRSKGQEISLLGTSGIPLGSAGIILFGIGPRWLSHSRVDYYYGIRDYEATDSRPFYVGTATWNLDINVTGIINLGEKWRLLALMNREGFGSAIKNSPIVDKTSAYSFVFSLSYKF